MLLQRLGAHIWVEEKNRMLCAEVKKGDRLKGNEYLSSNPITGATEILILCGCLAEGITRIWNPHIRPEILDLVAFLKKMGAKIAIHGQEKIEINGSETHGRSTHTYFLTIWRQSLGNWFSSHKWRCRNYRFSV